MAFPIENRNPDRRRLERRAEELSLPLQRQLGETMSRHIETRSDPANQLAGGITKRGGVSFDEDHRPISTKEPIRNDRFSLQARRNLPLCRHPLAVIRMQRVAPPVAQSLVQAQTR